MAKNFWLGMVKNWCGQSGLWTLKLTVPEVWTDGINWFFACKYSQFKRWLKIFGMSMVKNGLGQSDDRTLKLTLSEKWTEICSMSIFYKTGSGTSFSTTISVWFFKKNICYILLNMLNAIKWPNFIVSLPLLLRYWTVCVF